MTPKFNNLCSALLQAESKKKSKKKKNTYKWDSRSGKYYKPKAVSEGMSAGGLTSVFGANVDLTSGPFSSDSYAEGDTRIPKVLGAKKKKKKNKKERSVETIPVIRRPYPETIFLHGKK